MKQALAILAALFLLVRPLCDLQAAGVAQDVQQGAAHAAAEHDLGDTAPHGDTPCCAYLDEGAVAKLGEPAAVRLGAGDEPAIKLSARHPPRPARVPDHDVGVSPGAFFTSSSYYARSARIRR